MSLLLVVHCIFLLVLYNRLMVALVVCTNQRVASMYDCCLTINIWFVWYMRNLTVHCLWSTVSYSQVKRVINLLLSFIHFLFLFYSRKKFSELVMLETCCHILFFTFALLNSFDKHFDYVIFSGN